MTIFFFDFDECHSAGCINLVAFYLFRLGINLVCVILIITLHLSFCWVSFSKCHSPNVTLLIVIW